MDHGDTLLVRMIENPSTGYTWKLYLPRMYDWEYPLYLKETSYAPSNSFLYGHEGMRSFQFTASNAGKVTAQFVYGKPWEL